MNGGFPPYQRHSETSKAAASAIHPKTETLRAKVHIAILNSGQYGRTDLEIESQLGIGGSTVRPRRRELQMSGHVKDSGCRRKTASGRYAVVWVATNPNDLLGEFKEVLFDD
jgi:hypothetical protein